LKIEFHNFFSIEISRFHDLGHEFDMITQLTRVFFSSLLI